MSANKVCIVGAGASGMVAGISLVREGYQVSILEMGSKAGEHPYNPRLDVTPLDRSICDYVGLNLDPCFQKAERLDAYARSCHYAVASREDIPFLYVVERGPRESSLDSYLYKEALTESIWYLAMVVIGGMGSIMGVFIGAIVVRGLGFLIGENVVPWLTDLAAPGGALYGILPVNMYSRAGGVFPLLLSVVFILFLMYAPQGVAQWWGKFKLSYRFWPFSF